MKLFVFLLLVAYTSSGCLTHSSCPSYANSFSNKTNKTSCPSYSNSFSNKTKKQKCPTYASSGKSNKNRNMNKGTNFAYDKKKSKKQNMSSGTNMAYDKNGKIKQKKNANNASYASGEAPKSSAPGLAPWTKEHASKNKRKATSGLLPGKN
jgi:hypothetical protein